MKKLFTTIFAIAFLVISCNSNDDNSQVATQIPTTSTIMINGQHFSPDPNTPNKNNIAVQGGSSDGYNHRTFLLRKNNGIELHIHCEYQGIGVSGTYTNDLVEEGEPHRVGTGGFLYGGTHYTFLAGHTIVVTDLGNNNFKLELNNVIAAEGMNTESAMNISGTFTGNFIVESFD